MEFGAGVSDFAARLPGSLLIWNISGVTYVVGKESWRTAVSKLMTIVSISSRKTQPFCCTNTIVSEKSAICLLLRSVCEHEICARKVIWSRGQATGQSVQWTGHFLVTETEGSQFSKGRGKNLDHADTRAEPQGCGRGGDAEGQGKAMYSGTQKSCPLLPSICFF